MAEHGREARDLFTERFTLLPAIAGDPPLRRVALRAGESRVVDDRRQPVVVTAQRISDWRRGHNVPARFRQPAAVPVPLLRKASSTAPRPPVDSLYDLRTWGSWWKAAVSGRAQGEEGPAGPPPDTDTSESPLCPYRGPTSFRPEDSGWFFGRGKAAPSSTTTHLARSTGSAGDVQGDRRRG